MKLHDNQLKLLRHLARFNLLDYEECLEMLKTETIMNRTALSYVFRPLTKNQYVSKRKDGCVSILAKGRELFPELKPSISVGGGETERKRVMAVSRMAALMEKNGVPSAAQLPIEEHWKAMIHAAIGQAARQGWLPYFEKAFVEIGIVTPKGSNNARLWDTSNRVVNVIINNLKGIFFEDDNMEHMAFSVVAGWGEKGVTIIRISELDKVVGGHFRTESAQHHER